MSSNVKVYTEQDWEKLLPIKPGDGKVYDSGYLGSLFDIIHKDLEASRRVLQDGTILTRAGEFLLSRQIDAQIKAVADTSIYKESDIRETVKGYLNIQPPKATKKEEPKDEPVFYTIVDKTSGVVQPNPTAPKKPVEDDTELVLRAPNLLKPSYRTYHIKPNLEEDIVVKDGDTIHIGDYKARIAGVDSPESDQQPIAGKILAWSKAWFKANPELKITYLEADPYGRQVSVIESATTGEVYNLELVKQGYAFFNHKYPDVGDFSLQSKMMAADDANKEAWKEDPFDENKLFYYTQPEEWRHNLPQQGAHNPDIMGKNARVNGREVGKSSADTQIPWREDPEISSDSPYKFLEQQSTIAHLSRLYDSYYTSADVKIWIKTENGNSVMVDLITGVGYNYNVNSMPVYTIGSRFPAFFTRGNSIGNGTLVIPFKNTYYLKNILQYVFDEYTPTESERDASRIEDKAIEEMSDEDLEEFVAQSFRGVDIIDVGAVVSYFDIELRFDNSNAFQRDQLKSSIILKDCKLTGDTIEIASTRDGAIQQGYTFLFRNVVSGGN